MHQADRPARQRAGQRFRGAHVAGVVIGRAQGLGDAREVNHGIDAAQSLTQALPARQVADDGLDGGRQRARQPFPAHQASRRLASRRQTLQEMSADKAGPARNQQHYCGEPRNATSPK